jgi:O-acetyl-ADP-ribose deacetylase (regulator of RNase III)
MSRDASFLYEINVGNVVYFLTLGDLTETKVDAIVNAANPSLLGGGGVDGAIHREGGPKILEACREIRSRQGTCKPGDAVITTGGDLHARFVIHTVGPVWQGGEKGESEILARCYRASLSLARENGVKSLAFPSISTGAYRFPVGLAAKVAQRALIEELKTESVLERIGFCLFDRATYDAYYEALLAL